MMEFCDGNVAHETRYFADPFEPPVWRVQWVEQQEKEFKKKTRSDKWLPVSQEWTTRRSIMLEVLLEGSAWNALEEEEEQGDI
jgi:hypothetical protein